MMMITMQRPRFLIGAWWAGACPAWHWDARNDPSGSVHLPPQKRSIAR
jgi:hypothetical protein